MRWRQRKTETGFIAQEQFREMATLDRPQVEWQISVTLPLLDDDGYPWPLRRVRREVEVRGGHIRGTSRDWIFDHPDRPDFPVHFYEDGYVAVWFPCSDFDIPVPHDLTWPPEQVWVPGDSGPGTDLDDAILAILNGSYSETLTENADGTWRTYEWSLDGGESGRAVNPDGSEQQPEAGSRVWRYPAWPLAQPGMGRGPNP